MYLAEGYNFVIVSYVRICIKKKKKKKKNFVFLFLFQKHIFLSVLSVSVAAVCCLRISYKRTDKIPYTLRKRSYILAYVYVRSTRPPY